MSEFVVPLYESVMVQISYNGSHTMQCNTATHDIPAVKIVWKAAKWSIVNVNYENVYNHHHNP